MRVKHLNPRQGITTSRLLERDFIDVLFLRVKHLNPRQGITTPATNKDLIRPNNV